MGGHLAIVPLKKLLIEKLIDLCSELTFSGHMSELSTFED